jgi:flagellar hook assembly protein FlgD
LQGISSTPIRFALPTASRVKIEVFDLFGRRIRTLTDTQWSAGYHQVEWDRRDASGNALHSGVFMYRMSAGSFTDHKKLVITGN